MVNGISGTGSYFYMYRYNLSSGRTQAAGGVRMQAAQSLSAPDAGSKPAGNPAGKAQPVPPVRTVSQGDGEDVFPDLFIRKGVDPTEYAVRMRIQYMEPDGIELPGTPENVQGVGEAPETLEDGKCRTCEQRRYQDGSNDMGVSFKTPTRIAPEAAGARVRSHEQEHVSRERAKAEREDRQVISQSVTLHTDICPECGRVYISGGTTRTTTAARPEPAETLQPEAAGRRPFSAVA